MKKSIQVKIESIEAIVDTIEKLREEIHQLKTFGANEILESAVFGDLIRVYSLIDCQEVRDVCAKVKMHPGKNAAI